MWCIDIKIIINTTVITQQPWTSILVRTLLASTGWYSWVIWKLDMETPWSRIHKLRFRGIHLLKTFFKMSMVGLGCSGGGAGEGGQCMHSFLDLSMTTLHMMAGLPICPHSCPLQAQVQVNFVAVVPQKYKHQTSHDPYICAFCTKGRWHQLKPGKILKTLSRDAM